jgi:hypothetical protein
MSTHQQRTARFQPRAATVDTFGNDTGMSMPMTDEQAADHLLSMLPSDSLPRTIRAAARTLMTPAAKRTKRLSLRTVNRMQLVRCIAAAIQLLDIIDGDCDLEEDDQNVVRNAPLGHSEDDEANGDAFYGEASAVQCITKDMTWDQAAALINSRKLNPFGPRKASQVERARA